MYSGGKRNRACAYSKLGVKKSIRSITDDTVSFGKRHQSCGILLPKDKFHSVTVDMHFKLNSKATQARKVKGGWKSCLQVCRTTCQVINGRSLRQINNELVKPGVFFLHTVHCCSY